MCAAGRRGGLPVLDHAHPPGRLIVRAVALTDFRSYARLELELEPGLVLIVGPNGAGKTNLLESLHVGTQGFSPRTRSDARLVRFGQDAARIRLRGTRASAEVELEVTLRLAQAKHATLNGARLRTAEHLRAEVATLVFTPDRLVLAKGAPAARRAYFDRTLSRLQPSRAALPAEYGAALGQRNAALRGVAAGFSTRDALAPWTERVAELGQELVRARRQIVGQLEECFAERAGELGLPDARLRYEADELTSGALEERLDKDLDRGVTGLGPHLDDVELLSAGRDLRAFGSQGEQRLCVLALLLAEAELLANQRGAPPLLLLDDVLSELDPERRRILASRLRALFAQTLVTTTSAGALPAEPDQLVEVLAGPAGTIAA